MGKLSFPENFLWGAATAAYQVEGAVCEDNRGESIWDRFSHTPGKIITGETGDVACDHYNRYKEDVRLMKELGLKSYRFSIAWPRILPSGRGKVNQRGLDFYNRLTEALLENGIEPVATLYHWDLPQELQDLGGLASREIIDYFAEYASIVFKSLGDRVKIWVTLNEPAVVAFFGHAFGNHAPGLMDRRIAVQVSHHLTMSHARMVEVFRQMNVKNGEIGITLSLAPVHPATESPGDKEAARIYDGWLNRWFLDPVLKGSYPRDMLEKYIDELDAPYIKEGDMDIISRYSIDFLGVNYYTRHVIKKPDAGGTFDFETVSPEHSEYTDMGWEVCPEAFYELLARISREYGNPKMLITENGAAYRDDSIVGGIIADNERIMYLKSHLAELHRAIREGANVKGYFVWSLMDNFEWAYGYSKRFGIIYIDYLTQRRMFKKSALWYKEVIENNGFNI